MKLIAAILVLVVCVFADSEWTIKNGEQIKQIRTECLTESPLSPEQMNKMKTFEFPDEVEVRKYLLCTAQKLELFSSGKGYHSDRIAKQFKMDMEEEDVKKLADDCIAKFPKGDKPDDVAAYDVHKCLMGSVIGDKVQNLIKKRQEAAAAAAAETSV